MALFSSDTDFLTEHDSDVLKRGELSSVSGLSPRHSSKYIFFSSPLKRDLYKKKPSTLFVSLLLSLSFSELERILLRVNWSYFIGLFQTVSLPSWSNIILLSKYLSIYF